MENEELLDELDNFNELERRYLLTYLLTEDLDNTDLNDELDSIAGRLEDEEEGSEKEYYNFENKILDIYKGRVPSEKIDAIPTDVEEVALIKNRILLLYNVAVIDQDDEEIEELESIVTDINELLTQDNAVESPEFEDIDEQLAMKEEILIGYYFTDEEEHDHEDEDDDEEDDSEDEDDE